MFDNHFEAFLADTEPARETHFRLRYQVYCVDTGWENASVFPDEMERDSYDGETSIPFLVRRNRTRGWIATMRLIRRPTEELPIFGFAEIPPGRLPVSARDRIAEFSRLSVVTKYRRRGRPSIKETDLPLAPDVDDSFLKAGYRTRESWIFLGLIRAAYAYSLAHDIDFWLLLIADSLARIVRRSGFDIEPVGPEVEHRGPRRPYLFELRSGLSQMAARAPEVHEMLGHRPAYRLFSELPQGAAGVRRGARRGRRPRDVEAPGVFSAAP